MSIEQRFSNHIDQLFHWTLETTLLVAVSGGVDSMVLLHLLLTLPTHQRPKLIVAHVNHQLRKESDAEETLVRTYCAAHHLPLKVKKWSVKEHPVSGVEVAARKERYRYFERIMEQYFLDATVTAHHLNDQTETILMRFVRGNTLRGLTGMQFERPFGPGMLQRPLLDFSKAELYAYAQRHAIPYLEDSSNQTLDFTRNRYRNQILPLLREENPQVDAGILSFSHEIKDVLAVTDSVVEKVLDELVTSQEDGQELDKQAYDVLEKPMQRLVLRKLLDIVYKEDVKKPTDEQVYLIQEWLLEGKPNSERHLPNGVLISKEYETVWMGRKKVGLPNKMDLSITLQINQCVEVPPNKKVGLFRKESLPHVFEPQDVFCFSGEEIVFPLRIRTPKPGDRMQLKNGGMKKVSRIFIDQKVPRTKRETAFLVEDAKGKILWLPGFKESTLSIKDETDTIQYILVYYDKK